MTSPAARDANRVARAEAAVDPRIHLALERTLLAWTRTGLALMAFGFVVARFGLFLGELASVRGAPLVGQPRLSVWIGTALVALGVVVTAAAAAQQVRAAGRLRRGEPIGFRPVSLATLVALAVVGVGVLLGVYLIAGL